MSIPAAAVKELRERTGAGMMDCKQALADAGGDIEAAIDTLRKRGITKAAKKVGRQTSEGRVDTYVHPGWRVGVMVEINCETDFVAKTNEFGDFVKNICMQIAAANPEVVRREDLPEERVRHEREIFTHQARESGKPENVIGKIVDGMMNKFYAEACLLEQPYVRDPKQTVADYVNGAIAKIGENIQVRRFARFELGK
jgi:elongation factor Ts